MTKDHATVENCSKCGRPFDRKPNTPRRCKQVPMGQEAMRTLFQVEIKAFTLATQAP
jgi:hypothetical protein